MALAAVRFVTLWGPDGPRPFYAMWCLPAKGAMTDAVLAGANVVCAIDVASDQDQRHR